MRDLAPIPGPGRNAAGLLEAALDAAVPLHILDLAHLTFEQRAGIARECGEVIAHRGDDILFRSAKAGRSASAFNALARGLAAAAYQPGGVMFAGRHWCTDHAACEEAAR